jgi:hypothetical protein
MVTLLDQWYSLVAGLMTAYLSSEKVWEGGELKDLYKLARENGLLPWRHAKIPFEQIARKKKQSSDTPPAKKSTKWTGKR